MKPGWLRIAMNELIDGVREVAGPETNPKIAEYLKTVGLGGEGDETPWCSAFAQWVMVQDARKGSQMPNARSWLNWGEECQPKVGAITVLWRGSQTSWQGHVAFLLGWGASTVYLLGGNQGDSVSVMGYSTQRVLGYRWPSEET